LEEKFQRKTQKNFGRLFLSEGGGRKG